MMHADTLRIFHAVVDECDRADKKHGEQLDTLSLRGIGAMTYGLPPAIEAKATTDLQFIKGRGTWGDILVEEVCEALDEVNDPAALRAELVQVAAVAICWIRKLDAEAGR